MEYTTLYPNDDNTTMVELKIGDKVLNQAIPNENFDEEVVKAMAVFKRDVDSLPVAEAPKITSRPVTVTTLPEIPPEDNEPVQPDVIETPVEPPIDTPVEV